MNTVESREALRAKIKDNFKTMDIALDTVLDERSFCNGMVVSGAAGVGKSYNIIKRLEALHANAEIDFSFINSKCTSLSLYEKLYNARHNHCVLLLDDVDVWQNEDQINILKAALETKNPGQKRIISYGSTNSYMRDNGIPTSFDFQGKAIFITNKNLSAIANANTSLSPHMSAFMTRCLFVDLEIHDVQSTILHIENVMSASNILSSYGITKSGSDMILKFIINSQDKLREPSLRTAVLIANIFNLYPYDWEEHCEKLFLKR